MKSCEAVDLLSEFMFLKQVAEGHDRGFIWDAVGDWVDPSKMSLGGYPEQRFFHAWIAEVEALLHQLNPQQLLRRNQLLRRSQGLRG